MTTNLHDAGRLAESWGDLCAQANESMARTIKQAQDSAYQLGLERNTLAASELYAALAKLAPFASESVASMLPASHPLNVAYALIDKYDGAFPSRPESLKAAA